MGRVEGNLQKKMKASEWAFDRIKEAFELAAQDETENMSIVQEIMLRSTEYLRRIIAPVGGEGGVHNVTPVPKLQQFSTGRPRLVGLWGKTTMWWCANCGEK